jgi:hypothetical protein
MNSSYISIDLKTRFMPKEAGRLLPKKTTLTKPVSNRNSIHFPHKYHIANLPPTNFAWRGFKLGTGWSPDPEPMEIVVALSSK